MPLISVIIPVRNRKKYTCDILTQIHNQIITVETKTISVIVVDDGSTDGTREMIRNQFPDVILIEGDGSLWWTGAIRVGMEYAIKEFNPDFVVWLNDDILLSENFIENLCEICRFTESQNIVTGGIVSDQTYPDWIVFSGMLNKELIRSMDWFSTEETIEVDALNGNITIIPRLVVEKIGLPDVNRFRHYGGDFEYVFRAKNSGFRIILSSRLQAKTNYQLEDFIRYMPPRLQWYVHRDRAKRIEILKGLINLKCHYNIWHMVNINHFNSRKIPPWKYINFYFRQAVKLFVSDFLPIELIEKDIHDYLRQQKAPVGIIEAVIQKRHS